MHITKHGSSFLFQRRPPTDLSSILGTTPIRLALPAVNVRHAKRLGRYLSAALDMICDGLRRGNMSNISDDRAEIRERIRDQLKEILEEEGVSTTRADGAAQSAADDLAEFSEDAVYKHMMPKIARYRNQMVHMKARLSELETPGAEEREILERRADLRQLQASMVDGVRREVSDRIPEKVEYPRVSEVLDAYIKHREGDLGKGADYLHYTTKNAVRAFIEICGDKALDEWSARDVEVVNQNLSRLPANHRKLKRFKNVSIAEAAKLNEGLKSPYKTLAHSTVLRSYITPAKAAIEWLCGDYELPPPFHRAKIKRPRDARRPSERESFDYLQVAELILAA